MISTKSKIPARGGLSRFLSALRRRDMLCLITAYRQPSSRALSELGLNENAHLVVPDLSLAEIAAMLSAAGGDGDKWPQAVQRASAWGHPQCVQAIISGLRQRGWPAEERNSLLRFRPSADLDAERRAARGRIIAILSKETTKLLYRVSILFGRFDRPLALSVGAINPPVPQPGAHLDKLIGPWVELIVPPLEAWARAAWERAIEEQRFNLRSPASSVPAIREILASTGMGLGFLGRLIVSAQPAVQYRFDQTFRDFLLSV